MLHRTLQIFKVMPKDMHNRKVRQVESKVVRRIAEFQLPCLRELVILRLYKTLVTGQKISSYK
jgi:hypothetical protein